MRQIGPWWICLALALAAALRLPELARRPIHTDEAVHAAKLGDYLEGRPYEYDPNDYHGPTLNYLAAIAALARGQRTFAQLDQVTLRLVCAVCGIAMVLVPIALADGLGRIATIMAMLFTATSPAFAYYSRYFLHEPVLVLLSICLIAYIWRYLQRPSMTLAGLAGVIAGLIVSTKETWIIVFAAAVAGLVAALPQHRHCQSQRSLVKGLFVGIALCLVTAVLCYSSLLQDTRQVLRSIKAIGFYLSRAHTGPHLHPWYYYLDLLTWIPLISRPKWNEDLVVIGGLVGIIFLLVRQPMVCNVRLARFLCFYTAVMLAIYSAIPYKTPWCMLGMLHGLILVTAIFLAELIGLLQGRPWRIILTLAIAAFGVLVPLLQAYVLCFQLDCDPSNPYVYAHTTRDIPALVSRIDQIASGSGKGRQLYVQVICPPDDYWPLPWYLRFYPNVGYWPAVDFNYPPGDVILASPANQHDLLTYLYESRPQGSRHMYIMLMDRVLYIRPGVRLDAYIRKDIYDTSMIDQTAGIYDSDTPSAQ